MKKHLKKHYFKNKTFNQIKIFKKFKYLILYQLKIIPKKFILIFNQIKLNLKLTKKFKRSPTKTLRQNPFKTFHFKKREVFACL